ncbi:hypothetical protein IC582_018108 [Cucumis melo]
MLKVSARGITGSQDFSVLIDSLMLLSTVWERYFSVFEIRFSTLYSSVISRNSPAQRRGATLEELRSIFTP